MTIFIHNTPYTGPVQAVVLDWAGTAVDYGCMGPVAVFVEVFNKFEVAVTLDEARRFMGVAKKDHIRSMCRLPSVTGRWREKYSRVPDDHDVEALYAQTEALMVSAIEQHAAPIPGLLKAVSGFRRQGIKIGSTTGYTAPMVAVLAPAAQKQGYAPDAVVCTSDVPAGRPYPWMCYLNAVKLQTYPLEAMVKIGDTVNDIQEGLNAGMWTIGVTQSGNELGMTRQQAAQLEPEDLRRRLADIEQRFKAAGAHYVADGIWDCAPIVDEINQRLARGERPLSAG